MDAAARAWPCPMGASPYAAAVIATKGFVTNKMPDSPHECYRSWISSALNRVVYDAGGQDRFRAESHTQPTLRFAARLEAGSQAWDSYSALYKAARRLMLLSGPGR